MERWGGRWALVTGASAGIGYAIVEVLAQHGVNVIGCARNIEKIESLSRVIPAESGKVQAIKCDVTKEEEILDMFKTIEQQHGHVDILINNAGMARPDNLVTGKTDKWREMINVNVMGLSICTREALRLMEKDGVDNGHIFHINSMAGHRVPKMASTHFYSATKHMVTALTEGLYQELKAKKSKIRITSLSPGVVKTEFGQRMFDKADMTIAESIAGVGPAELAAMKFMASMTPLESKDVADAVVFALGAPEHVCVKELTMAPTEQPF